MDTEEERHAEMMHEIQMKRDELEKYVMTLCHELRTPLNGTLGMLQVLKVMWEGQPASADKANMLDEMVREVARSGNPDPLLELINANYRLNKAPTASFCLPILDKAIACGELQLAIVEDLLDYTRSQTGKGAVARSEEFNLREALESAMEIVRSAHPKRDDVAFETRVEYHVKTEEMVGDRRRIVQLLINLLSNAFKATTSGSVVLVARPCKCLDKMCLHHGYDTVCIDVTDTGVGMSPAAITRNLETPFAAGSSSSTTGLGFGIVRHVVEEILFGKLSVTSERNVGTTIHVALPLKRTSGSGHGGCMWTADAPRSKYSPASQFHILVVDDQEMNLDMMTSLLHTIGHTENVDVADDGDVALAMIDARYVQGLPPYRVVFMDVSMRRKDGDAATAELRRAEENENRKKTYIVGLSAYANDSVRDKCLSNGMDAYYTKPMQLQKMQEVLSSLPTEEHVAPMLPKPCLHQPPGMSAFALALAKAKSGKTFAEKMAERKPKPSAYDTVDKSIVDLSTALQNSASEASLQRLIHSLFVAPTETLSDLAQRQEWEALHKTVHSIKGITLYLYAQPAANALRALEERVLVGEAVAPGAEESPLPDLVQKVELEISRLKEALSAVYIRPVNVQ